MRRTVALVLLALAPTTVAAEVIVRVSEGRVDLAATAAPLGDILDRLARQTGMKVVYEGPAPRQLVTLSIRGRTPAQAVLSVLEGSGVNFALLGDAGGAGVQTLVVAGASATSAPSGAATPPSPDPRRPFGSRPGSSPDKGQVGVEEEDLPEEPGLPPGVPPSAETSESAGGSATPSPNVSPVGPPKAPGGPTTSPGFSASPFTPQPQPFPPALPAPAAPPPNPGSEEDSASAVPPPP